MCGIFGLVQNDLKNINQDHLGVLASRMTHRGPDDEGIISKEGWGIGMRRLSIIDLSGGRQPISNEDKNIHLVANGEIYNYKELRKMLLGLGYSFSTESDVEVILHLYQEYGYEGIHKLNGMFAFALFDEITSTLWIARDRLGIKPLYFCQTDKSFGFSSELTGLARIFESDLNKESILDYLGYSYVPAPKTIFKDIFKLLPGEEAFIRDGVIKRNIYWSHSIKEKWKGNLNDAVSTLDNLLKQSIKMQLISDVPLGVFLSGGVDSSAIASYASEITKPIPLETFTIEFEGKQGEDSKFAKEISEELETNHHSITVTAREQFEALSELIELMDEPMSDSAIVPTYMLSKAARKKGIKVLLSGAGGDEIFGGYPRHFPEKKFSAGWFASLPKPLLKITSIFLGIINPAYRIRFLKPSRNFVANISGVNFNFLKKVVRSSEAFDNLLKRIDKDYLHTASKSSYPLMKIDVNDYLPNNVLSLTDKATMATSVEGRVPLIDHEIVEFAFSLPEKINILNGEQKGLFKKTLTERLPQNLLWRKKEGFNAPINYWVEKWPQAIKEELLTSFSPLLNDILDKDVLVSYLSDDKLRRRAGASLYSLYVLNKWLNSYEVRIKN